MRQGTDSSFDLPYFKDDFNANWNWQLVVVWSFQLDLSESFSQANLWLKVKMKMNCTTWSPAIMSRNPSLSLHLAFSTETTCLLIIDSKTLSSHIFELYFSLDQIRYINLPHISKIWWNDSLLFVKFAELCSRLQIAMMWTIMKSLPWNFIEFSEFQAEKLTKARDR